MSFNEAVKYLEEFFDNAKKQLAVSSPQLLAEGLKPQAGKRIDGRFNLMPAKELGKGVQYYINDSANFVVVDVFKDGSKIEDVHLSIPKTQSTNPDERDTVHFTDQTEAAKKAKYRMFIDYKTKEVKKTEGEIPKPELIGEKPLAQGARSAVGVVRGPGMPQRGKKGGTRRADPSTDPTKSLHSFALRMKTRRAR